MADEFKFKRGDGGLISESRIWETRDGRVVAEGDPDAHSLIAGAGGRIHPRTAHRLGITKDGIKARKAAAEVVQSTAEGARAAKAEPEEKEEPAPSKALSTDTIKKKHD